MPKVITEEQQGLLAAIKEAITSLLGGDALHVSIDQYGENEVDISARTTMIIKNEAECLVTGIVLEPEVEDAHGDIYSEEEIYKGMESFNVHCRRSKLQHSVDSGAVVVESWTAKNDEVIGGQNIKKGTWLMTTRLPPEEYALVQKGVFTGYSVGCRAVGTNIQKAAKRRLSDFDFSAEGSEVSLVDKAANRRTILITKSEDRSVVDLEKNILEAIRALAGLTSATESEEVEPQNPLQSVLQSLLQSTTQLTEILSLDPVNPLQTSSLEGIPQPQKLTQPLFTLEKNDMSKEDILKSLESEEGQELLKSLIEKAASEKTAALQQELEVLQKAEFDRAEQAMAESVASYADLGVKEEDIALFKAIAASGEGNLDRFQEILNVSKSALSNAGALDDSGASSLEDDSNSVAESGLDKELHAKAEEIAKSEGISFERAVLKAARS